MALIKNSIMGRKLRKKSFCYNKCFVKGHFMCSLYKHWLCITSFENDQTYQITIYTYLRLHSPK